MRKFFLFILLLCAIVAFILFRNTNSTTTQKSQSESQNTQISTTPTPIASTALFVPYWTLSSTDALSNYTQLIYFGITANTTGIDTQEDGYKNLSKFTQLVPAHAHKLLTLRLIDAQRNQQIIQDSQLQEKIISQTMQIAEANHFDGIVLDFEYSGVAFPSVTNSVTNFSTSFANQVKTQNLSFYQSLYGDTLYLGRPYDIQKIGQTADGILVLAYDFHKANGTPGPNFPLMANADSDYNFPQMLEDFAAKVPKNKLTIVFGMFGYDWAIDEKGRPIQEATSLSDLQIQEKFLSDCQLKNCTIHKNSTTEESSVSYTDNQGNNHIVWFEDNKSGEKKKTVLQQEGFSSIGFWANGYF